MPRGIRTPIVAGARRRFHASAQRRPTTFNFFSSTLPSRVRSFTQKPSLLLVSRPVLRPQLPFLHPSSIRSNPRAIGRFISTETRARWKARLRWQIRFQAYAWPAIALFLIIAAGVKQTKLEYEYPTPRDWTFWSRWYLRTALFTERHDDAKVARVLTDWAGAGYHYKRLLQRLEDEKLDGQDTIASETLVEGIGRTGFDISTKSEQWRRGYYQALMGAAKVAEHLDGVAKKRGENRGRLIPWESVPGPSNPRPKPLPWDRKGRHKDVPNELECEDAYQAPEKWYMKILTTQGFDNGQRLEAALAYADWCEYKGLNDTAGNMYDWALDIAAGGLPMGSNNVVDIKTGVINKGQEDHVTQNLLRATTALGVHHARLGEVKEALPIFLSVLRARKNLPAKPIGYVEPAIEQRTYDNPFWEYAVALKNAFFDSPYPHIRATGDSRPFHSLKEACEEVGLMTYIGEILFATSATEREKGLSWTRDSVEAAEAVMWVMEEHNDKDGEQVCRECLDTGLKNWQAMTKQMAKLSIVRERDAEKSSGFLGTGLGRGSAINMAKKEVQRWQEEEAQVELRRQKTAPLIQPLKPTRSGWMTV